MKAIQIKQPGGPETLEFVDLPVPQAKSNEAVVKIAAAGINFIDVYQREGRYKVALPFVAGQEGAGIVTSVGADVKSVSRRPCRMDRHSGKLRGIHRGTRRPSGPGSRGLSDQQAAATMLQGITAHYLIYSTFVVKNHDTVLVHAAAGGVGLLLVQLAHNLGARVIGTVSTEEKAKLARAAGADEIILYTQADFEAETKRLTGGKVLTSFMTRWAKPRSRKV